MKLSDLENAEKANRILERLNRNIEIAQSFLNQDLKSDSGGIKGHFEKGFFCNLSEYKDGIGMTTLDLGGCYVAYEVYEATLNVLIKQREKVLNYLESINVDTEEVD